MEDQQRGDDTRQQGREGDTSPPHQRSTSGDSYKFLKLARLSKYTLPFQLTPHVADILTP